MHIPSERVYCEMKSEEASLWFVPANDGEEVAFIIKAPTSGIKALIAGCPLNLVFGIKDTYLCVGVRILDMPDTPIFISGIQKELEEHRALIRAFQDRIFPVFLFNEMDVCLAWTNAELSEADATTGLTFLEQAPRFYTGAFNEKASYALDCFCYSVDTTALYPSACVIPTFEIDVVLEQWRSTELHCFNH